ncbi:hypothetical protein C0585_01380 [Candidatus Woesearchaeota archaeon]|nr:MAG: hypothetical protein C0585_01380 [Candidatus Woesearchaeota archaeon]
MKTVFFESKDDMEIIIPKDLIKVLPKKIIMFTTVQHVDQIESMKNQLEDIEVKTIKLSHTKHPGQILGCSIRKIEENCDAFLYIGDGEFHPKALVLKNDKPVYSYNPYSKDFKSFEDADNLKKRQKAGLVKFHSSKEIGVLITLKPGQNRMKKAKELKELYPDKNFYFLMADTFDFGSLEDFNFLECFVNTACPRIGYDDNIKIFKPVVNIEELNNQEW